MGRMPVCTKILSPAKQYNIPKSIRIIETVENHILNWFFNIYILSFISCKDSDYEAALKLTEVLILLFRRLIWSFGELDYIILI